MIPIDDKCEKNKGKGFQIEAFFPLELLGFFCRKRFQLKSGSQVHLKRLRCRKARSCSEPLKACSNALTDQTCLSNWEKDRLVVIGLHRHRERRLAP